MIRIVLWVANFRIFGGKIGLFYGEEYYFCFYGDAMREFKKPRKEENVQVPMIRILTIQFIEILISMY